MNRVAFIFDQFELQSPGQQLLDRFLIGYKHNDEFKSPPGKVVISIPKADQIPLVQSRVKDFGLEVADSLERAVKSADAVLLAPGSKKSQEPVSIRLQQALATLTPKQKVFIDGSLLLTEETVDQRQSPVIVSRAASHLFPLPISPAFRGTNVQRALIVVQGIFPDAELDAFYAIRPYLGNSWTQTAAPTIQHLQDPKLWDFAYSSDWCPLLGAAISRSNNIKGDPDKDGRTQDIVGLQLIEKLALKARGWHLQHTSGLQMLVLVGDGALADFNFAVEANGRIDSAQLYHGQSPMENHYDEMAAFIIDQFTSPTVTSNLREALFINDILRAMKPLTPSS